MSRFNLVEQHLRTDLANLQPSGADVIRDTMYDILLGPNGSIKSQFLSGISITDVFVVADYVERDLLNPTEGDFVQVLIDNTSWIRGDTSWIQMTSSIPNLQACNDVIFPTSLLNNQALIYDSTLEKWTNRTLSLSVISDVLISAPTNTQIISYDSASGKWKNINHAHNISSLGGVVITSPVSGQTLLHNGTNFINTTLNLDLLADVVIGTSQTNQALIYTGAAYVNAFMQSSYLSDYTVSAPLSNHIMVYNSGTSKFVNQRIQLSTLSDVDLVSVSDAQFMRYNGTTSKWTNATVSIVSVATLTAHTGTASIHRTLPDPIGQNGKQLIVSADVYSLQSNTIDNHSEVIITSKQTNDILQWNGTSWVNVPLIQTQKTYEAITTSRNLNDSDFGKILYYTGSSYVVLSMVDTLAVSQGATIEVYNMNTAANLSFAQALTNSFNYIIVSQNGTLNIGRYAKLVYIGNAFIMTTDYSIDGLYKSITDISSELLITPTLNVQSRLYVATDCNRMVYTYKSGGFVRYFAWDYGAQAQLSHITSNLTPNHSNILSNADLAHYVIEWSAPNIYVMSTFDFFTTISNALITALATGAVCKSMVYNYSTQKINIPFMDASNQLKFGSYQLSNGNVAVIIPVPQIVVVGVIDIVAGYSMGYGVVVMKTSTQLSIVSASSLDDFTSGITGSNTSNFTVSNTDSSLASVYDSDTTNRLRFLTGSASSTTLWEMAANHRSIVRLATFPASPTVLNNGVSLDNVIYVPINHEVMPGVFNSSIYRYTPKKHKTRIAYNVPFQRFATTTTPRAMTIAASYNGLVSWNNKQNANSGFIIDTSASII